MEQGKIAKDDASRRHQGDLVIDTHIAYFFVPLPDPLWLPDKYVVKVNAETPLEWMAATDDYVPQHTAVSLCHHRVNLESARLQPLDLALWDLAARALPTRADDKSAGERDGSLDERAARDVAATMVEMAVGFTLTDEDEDASEVISDAFDRGLAACREVQRAYYLARREPVRLVARETLPFAIPHAVRRLRDDEGHVLPFQVEMSLFLTNMNIAAPEAPWSPQDGVTFHEALRHRAARAAFAESMDFSREAKVALYRDGAYSVAVLTTATACETLLDDLLASMLWEEEQRPEHAAALFDSFLVARVKREYSARLGGTWSTEGRGAVAAWATDVAGLRNRVIHAGYEPTHAEAQRALDVAGNLQTFLGDRVASRLKKYPRTAAVLPGRDGLKRRKRWTRGWETFAHDETEVNWRDTFARWRLAMRQALPESPLAVPPDPRRAAVSVVVHAGGETVWIAHDREAGQAAAIRREDALDVSADQLRALEELSGHAREQGQSTSETFSVQFIGASVSAVPADAWKPEYRLVPGAGVMVTGVDLDPPD